MSRSSEIARADREDRERWGIPDRDGIVRGRSVFGKTRQTFYPMLPPAPQGFCTRERAAAYVREIDRILDINDTWTRQERSALSRLRKKWQRRADGLDGRFNALGGAFGGTNNRDREVYTPGDCLADLRKLVEAHRPEPVRMLTDADRFGPPAKQRETKSVQDTVKSILATLNQEPVTAPERTTSRRDTSMQARIGATLKRPRAKGPAEPSMYDRVRALVRR